MVVASVVTLVVVVAVVVVVVGAAVVSSASQVVPFSPRVIVFGQLQAKLPSEFVHVWLHPPFPDKHSLMSITVSQIK